MKFKTITCGLLVLALSLGTVACGASGSSESASAGSANASANSGAASSGGTKEPVMTLKVASTQPTSHVAYPCYETLKENIEKRTDGAIAIEIYTDAALGSDTDNVEAVKNGATLISCAGVAMLDSIVPDMSVLGAPYLFEDSMDYEKLNDSDWFESIREQFSDEGIKIFDLAYCGDRYLLTHNEVNTPDDVKGQTLRSHTSPMYFEICNALCGGTATTMAWSEVYSALSQGVIDAAEGPVGDIVAAKLYEVVERMALTHHMTLLNVHMMSKDVFESIPEEYKDIVAEELENCCANYSALIKDSETANIQAMSDNGVDVNEVDIDAFKAITESVYDKFPDWSPNLKETVRSAVGYID